MPTEPISHQGPERIPGPVFILLAATLWGTTGTTQALAPNAATPIAVGWLRLAVGGGALMALALWRGRFRDRSGWMRPAVAVSGLSTAVYQACFFAGVSLTGVAVGTIVGIGSSPIFAGILGWAARGERLRRRWFLATGLAVTGCALLALSGGEDAAVDPVGLLLALGAGLAYAIFTLVNKRLIETRPPDAVMAVAFCIGAVVALPALLFVDTGWIATPGGIAVALHLGLIATGLSYLFFGQGLRTTPVSTTGTLTLAEPLTAALLGILLLDETLTATALIGIGVLLAGLLVLVAPSRRRVMLPPG